METDAAALYSPYRHKLGFWSFHAPNYWRLKRILRKSHIPAKDIFVDILCGLPVKFYEGAL